MPVLQPTRRIVGPRLGAPRWPFEVNWSSPITKDLVFLFVYPFGQPINLVGGRGLEATSSTSLMASRFGPTALHTERVQFSYSPLNPGSGPVTIMSAANPSSTVRESIICQRVANQTNQIELRAGADTIGNPSLTDMSFFVLDGSGGGATASGACDGEYHWFVGRRDGTDMSLFVDGAPQASSTVAVRSITDAGTFVLGGLPNTSTIHYNQNKIIDAGWHRALTDSEIWALYDPSTRWDLIHELGRRSYFFPAAAGSVDSLTATGIATGAPSVGGPALGQAHALTAAEVAAGAPSVGSPTVGQGQGLTAIGVASGAPSVGTPAIGQEHALAAAGVATSAPSVGAPAMGQEHGLAATGVATGAPSVGTPALAEGAHPLDAAGIATGAPAVGSPTIGQAHVLAAADVIAGAPVFDVLSLGQEHALAADGIVAGTPALGTPSLIEGSVVPPAERIVDVAAQGRSISVGSQSRTLTVSAGTRSKG